MSAEGIHCNGDAKQLLSLRDGFITYRRKRARSSTPFFPREDATPSVNLKEHPSASAAGKVSDKSLPKKRSRDIGWDHGVRVNGNRFLWKCNWCGLVRAGGVCRLKNHLAGGPEVQKCPKVPDNIAKVIRKHLRPAVLRGLDMMNSKRSRLDALTDKECTYVDMDMPEDSASQRIRGTNKHSRAKGSRATSRRSNKEMSQELKEPPDTMLHMSFFDKDGCERADNNWRNILEDMLQLPDVSEGGGILECVRTALRLCSSGSSKNANMINLPDDTTESKGRCEEHYEMQGNSQRLGSSDMSKPTIFDKVDVNGNTPKCQNVLLKILCSEKFSLLCDLLCGSLVEKKALEMVDFSLINSKMKSGDYEQSPGLFDKDIQQVWEKLKKIGQLMFHLASSLSNLSLASIQKQVGEDLLHEAGDQKFEEICEVGVEQRNSMDSNTTTQFPCYESDRSTKPEQTQTEGSCLYKVCICKQCGNEADGKRSLICDGCEAMYHFSCIEPVIQEIPSRTWYCAACMANRKETSEPLCGRKSPGTISNCRPEPLLNDIQQDKLHENCVVCDRLDVAETQECPNKSGKIALIANGSRESSVSSMESDEPPEPSRTAMLLLCKKCGTCEDDNKRFLVCGHTQCPYKFYHIRCLKTNQIAIPQQKNLPCWYCPSCLCRSCFDDKDDDQIVLCDGCDEAYHIYCMEPPRTSIPKGQWYCISCNVNRAKEGMRRYEQLILQHHSKKAVNQANELNNSMDILLKAAEKLSSEERLKARRLNK